MKQPEVSILISAYNCGDFIFEAVSSALNQTHLNYEVLVMDDGSTDHTLEVLKSFSSSKLRVFSRENRGKSASINELLAKCRSPYFVMQDGDDISMPERLAKLCQFLNGNPQVALVFSGHALLIGGRKVSPVAKRHRAEECAALIDNFHLPAHDPTMAGRTAVALDHKFDEGLSIGEGVDFIFRVGEQHPVEALSDVLYLYRIHENSLTKSKKSQFTRQMLCVMNKARTRRGLDLIVLNGATDAKRYKLSNDGFNNLHGTFMASIKSSLENQDRQSAYQTAWVSARHVGYGWSYLKPLIYYCLKLWPSRLRSGIGHG